MKLAKKNFAGVTPALRDNIVGFYSRMTTPDKHGVAPQLAALKAARHSALHPTTGFDLVAAKHSVVDDEIARLGLNFTTRATTARRYVHRDSYAAGKAAGALFEPNAALGG